MASVEKASKMSLKTVTEQTGSNYTRFIVEPDGIIHDMKPTIDRINAGKLYSFRNDGVVYYNKDASAFDPSYISKSGKCTPYLGRFWSGCAKMAKHGLEISGIGIIDMDLHTCFHLEAVQTPPVKTLEQAKWTLIDWYLHVLRTRKETLQRLTKYVVADAYFSKSTFVDGALDMGFHVISRFRDDAYFRYLTTEQPTGKKGRPKLYDGKIDMKHLEEERFEIIQLEKGRILSAIVNSRSLGRDIRLCIWESDDKKVRKLYFSTDTQMKAMDVLDYYRTRFQIEFCTGTASNLQGWPTAKVAT